MSHLSLTQRVLKEPEAATRKLGSADAHWDNRWPEEDPPWMYWMRRPSETIEANMALIEVHRSAETENRLQRWISSNGDRFSRDRAFSLTVIACAQLAANELDKALATARAAAESLRKVESGRIADELSKFTRRLPANDPAAQEFMDQLADLEGTHGRHTQL